MIQLDAGEDGQTLVLKTRESPQRLLPGFALEGLYLLAGDFIPCLFGPRSPPCLPAPLPFLALLLTIRGDQ